MAFAHTSGVSPANWLLKGGGIWTQNPSLLVPESEVEVGMAVRTPATIMMKTMINADNPCFNN